jgi:hypothetical protein
MSFFYFKLSQLDQKIMINCGLDKVAMNVLVVILTPCILLLIGILFVTIYKLHTQDGIKSTVIRRSSNANSVDILLPLSLQNPPDNKRSKRDTKKSDIRKPSFNFKDTDSLRQVCWTRTLTGTSVKKMTDSDNVLRSSFAFPEWFSIPPPPSFEYLV